MLSLALLPTVPQAAADTARAQHNQSPKERSKGPTPSKTFGLLQKPTSPAQIVTDNSGKREVAACQRNLMRDLK